MTYIKKNKCCQYPDCLNEWDHDFDMNGDFQSVKICEKHNNEDAILITIRHKIDEAQIYSEDLEKGIIFAPGQID